MTKPPIPTENSKTKGQHTQTPPKTSITQRLRTDLGLNTDFSFLILLDLRIFTIPTFTFFTFPLYLFSLSLFSLFSLASFSQFSFSLCTTVLTSGASSGVCGDIEPSKSSST